jgi:hypothetical protein
MRGIDITVIEYRMRSHARPNPECRGKGARKIINMMMDASLEFAFIDTALSIML